VNGANLLCFLLAAALVGANYLHESHRRRPK